jgi:hypothetical protein
MELKAVFDQIQAAERDGNLNPEEKRKLEEQAAEKGLQALFKASHTHFYSPFKFTQANPTGRQSQAFAPLHFKSSVRPTCRSGKRMKRDRKRTNTSG